MRSGDCRSAAKPSSIRVDDRYEGMVVGVNNLREAIQRELGIQKKEKVAA